MIWCTRPPSLVPIHLREINEVDLKHCAKFAPFFLSKVKAFEAPLINIKMGSGPCSFNYLTESKHWKGLKLIFFFFHKTPSLKKLNGRDLQRQITSGLVLMFHLGICLFVLFKLAFHQLCKSSSNCTNTFFVTSFNLRKYLIKIIWPANQVCEEFETSVFPNLGIRTQQGVAIIFEIC